MEVVGEEVIGFAGVAVDFAAELDGGFALDEGSGADAEGAVAVVGVSGEAVEVDVVDGLRGGGGGGAWGEVEVGGLEMAAEVGGDRGCR